MIEIDSQEKLAEMYLASRRLMRRIDAMSKEAGIEPRQYELLLAVSRWRHSRPPTVRNISQLLGIRHNTTVELIDRTVEKGAIERSRDHGDRRQVFLALTPEGDRMLKVIAEAVLRDSRAEGTNGEAKLEHAGQQATNFAETLALPASA